MTLNDLQDNWDLIIIGGGITGAGTFYEASRMGLKVLLVEQKDFAWGTSSRSSKLVHGGLRYLKEGRFFLTKIAVEERERLLKEAPGLVESLGFFLPVYEGQGPGKRLLKVGLSLYDIMARERQHQFYDAAEFTKRVPQVKQDGLQGGFYFLDAQVDDSRLVLRLINEAVKAGDCALNYTTATDVLRNPQGQVSGINVEDTETHETKTLYSRAIINATGAWAEKLHPSPEPNRHLRPLRGSHLVFPARALPLVQGFSFVHPLDKRMVFVIPWEGSVLVGTTDLDHKEDLSKEPAITLAEVSYLMQGLQAIFPSLGISLKDAISTFAGIRPVLSEGKLTPSAESREHIVWVDKGLITVTGGKLTTFRRLARDALKAAKPFLPSDKYKNTRIPLFSNAPDTPEKDYGLSNQMWRRLYGRYGKAANDLVKKAASEDLELIPDTHTLWAELPFVAAHEQVRHLSDLLLRRVRLGLLTPQGGKIHIKRIQKLCRPVLSWNRKRWKKEIHQYFVQWNHSYATPLKKVPVPVERKVIFFKTAGEIIKRLIQKIRHR
jgi:glycerol-3-phosphate dehydrogenase